MLKLLAVGGRKQVVFRGPNNSGRIRRGYLNLAAFKKFKEALRVLLFIFSRFKENKAYLLKTLFFGRGREICVTVPCLGLSRESRQKILFSLCALNAFHNTLLFNNRFRIRFRSNGMRGKPRDYRRIIEPLQLSTYNLKLCSRFPQPVQVAVFPGGNLSALNAKFSLGFVSRL